MNNYNFLMKPFYQASEDHKSPEVRAVFLDISKAFDNVCHDGLIFKLKQNDISVCLLKLFENYLHNRKQRMVLNVIYSDYSTIESGGPEGSVLGHLLSMILRILNLISNFFANDTMLFPTIKDPVTSAGDLNHDLDIIYQWAHQWKMEFNPDPTKQATEVLFSCKKSTPNHRHLIFNGIVLLKG